MIRFGVVCLIREIKFTMSDNLQRKLAGTAVMEHAHVAFSLFDDFVTVRLKLICI